VGRVPLAMELGGEKRREGNIVAPYVFFENGRKLTLLSKTHRKKVSERRGGRWELLQTPREKKKVIRDFTSWPHMTKKVIGPCR